MDIVLDYKGALALKRTECQPDTNRFTYTPIRARNTRRKQKYHHLSLFKLKGFPTVAS